MSRLSDLLLAPGAFFARLGESPSLAGPAAVVALNGAAGTAEYLVFLSLFGDPWDQLAGGSREVAFAVGDITVSAPQVFALSAVWTIAIQFVLWGLGTVAVYAVARYLDGAVTPRRAAALLGWGALPFLLRPIAGLLFTAAAALTAPEFSSEAAAMSWAEETFANSPVRTAIRESLPLLSAWTAGLWFVGARRGLGLDRWRAAAALALPVAWLLLVSLPSLSRLL